MQSIDNFSVDELKVIQGFKAKMPQAESNRNLSPFDDQITKSYQVDTVTDVEDVHRTVRDEISTIIAQVRSGKKRSHIVLLAGPAGSGKTHLLNTFRAESSQNRHGHVFVGGSNHWKIEEFESRLLDWVIEAVTAPSPSEEHLLLERIRDIAFRAYEHCLNHPLTWKTCLKKSSLRLLGRVGRWLHRWRMPSHAKLVSLVNSRNHELFEYLEYTTFSTIVCDRFLAERSNLLHRFTLQVLLLYLFPDESPVGLNTRERIAHWLRGKAEHDYFAKRLGSYERLDLIYSKVEAIKLIIHLFSASVSSELSSETRSCPARVFLLTFDQTEGRNELFDSEQDWRNFFAHLSELYNTLPNIVIVFTMTLALRTQLHSSMERQFKDRIRMDDRFVLGDPSDQQLKAIYQNRVIRWLNQDAVLLQKYQELSNPLIPFNNVIEIAIDSADTTERQHLQTIRGRLNKWDIAFKEMIRRQIVGPSLDYDFELNEIMSLPEAANEYAFTDSHLDTLKKLIIECAETLYAYGLSITPLPLINISGTPVLRLEIRAKNRSGTFTLNVARLGWHYTEPSKTLVDTLLNSKPESKTFLLLLRPQPIANFDFLGKVYQKQILHLLCSANTECIMRALITTNQRRPSYEALPDGQAQVQSLSKLIRAELDRTYFRELYGFCSSKLDLLEADQPSEQEPDAMTSGQGMP